MIIKVLIALIVASLFVYHSLHFVRDTHAMVVDPLIGNPILLTELGWHFIPGKSIEYKKVVFIEFVVDPNK